MVQLNATILSVSCGIDAISCHQHLCLHFLQHTVYVCGWEGEVEFPYPDLLALTLRADHYPFLNMEEMSAARHRQAYCNKTKNR